jgi:lipopolysaccharide/colanic/teichoic acid biosynthesis glycosyltransferase
MLDPLIAVVALVLLSPILGVIALLIWLDSSGPALLVQTRIGKGGRPFPMLKFRTMFDRPRDPHHIAFMQAFIRGQVDQLGGQDSTFKPSLDSELTRVGKFLRKTSLDELPQLVNVIKGDMSLIGPRPNVPWEVDEYKEWHMQRLDVLPGITGLAQVNGRSGIDFDTIVRYDIEYARNQSLALDLQIIWRTFAAVADGKGAK